MLLSKLEQWKQQHCRQGREEGFEQVRREIILARHGRDFDAATIADVTGLPWENVKATILGANQNDTADSKPLP
ncbi:MAG: hypothetical protein WDZ49_00540 [Litorilinea sp.]